MIRLLPLLVLVACGGSEPAPEAAHDHGDGTHTHEAGGTPASTATAAPATGAADVHADHHATGSGHMADMAATREKLRETLGAAYDAPVAGLDTADPAKGKEIYDRLCASCHGAEGKGDGEAGKGLTPPPADFTDGFHARWYSDAARVHILREGIEGTAMPGFGSQLSDAETLDLYGYVRSLRPAPSAAPTGHDPGAAAHDHGAAPHDHGAAPHDHGDGTHEH